MKFSLVASGSRSSRPWARRGVLSGMAALVILAGGTPGSALAPRAAFAQAPAPLDKMKELNKQAVADYAAEDYESALLGLREAITFGARNGLGEDPFMARLWINLASVYINGLKDKARGQKSLARAVEIQPDIKPTDTMTSPALKEALAAAQPAGGTKPAAEPAAPSKAASKEAEPAAAGKTEGAAAETEAAPVKKKRKRAGEEPDLPANIPQPLYCPMPDEAPPDENVVLYCVLQPAIDAAKVVLRYRPAGAETFKGVSTTHSSKGWWKVVIPAAAMSGKSLQYFLEARDGNNKLVASAGRDDSPNLILVREGTAPVTGAYAGTRARRTSHGDEDETAREDDDPLAAIDREKARERETAGVHRRAAGAIFVGISLGSGYGWHPKENLEFYTQSTIDAGWIPSGLIHVLPEVGLQISDRVALSALVRAQIISQTGSGDAQPGSPASGAFALLGRLQYFLGGGNLQGSLSAYAGGGTFRLTLGPPGGDLRRNDSVKGGPFMAGAGVGVIYHVNPHVALVLDGRGLYGTSTTAAVIDGSAGVEFAF